MTWILVIVLVLVVSFIIMKPLAEKETERQKHINNKIKTIYREFNFIPQKEYLSAGNDSLIAYSNDDKFIFMNIKNALDVNTDNHVFKYFHVSSDDILEVEIFKDKESMIKTSKMGLAGGAVVGGLVAGGIGSIIGSMTANKRNIHKIKELSLKITINDKENPIHTITIFDCNKGIQGENHTKKALDEIGYWFNLLKVIIHENKNKTVTF